MEAAEQLRLDVARFHEELAAHTHAARAREDFLSDVNGASALFINGVRYDDSYELEVLLAALERASTQTSSAPLS